MRIIIIIFLLLGSFTAEVCSARVHSPAEFVFDLHSIAYSFTVVPQTSFAETKWSPEQGPRWYIHAGVAAAHAAAAYPAYDYLTGVWGQSNGKFHLKDETHDYLAFNDEVSHTFVSYKLTQFFTSVYHGLGYQRGKSRVLGAVEAAAVMTFVEFPVDAFNPDQGLGVTDLLANYVGVGLAYLKSGNPSLSDLDLKLSIKSFDSSRSKGLGYDSYDYDNYIYWLTYRERPAVIGVGYSTARTSPTEPLPELYLGIGTTLPDLISLFSSDLARKVRSLEFYYFNLNLQIR